MVAWLSTVGIFLLTLYLYRRWSKRKLYAFASELDGPTFYTVFGSTLLQGGRRADEIVPFLNDLIEEYGTLFRVWMGPLLAISVSSPADVEVVLNSCPQKGFFYRFFNCEKGLITAAPEIWKVHRKLLNPSFNLRILKSFIPIFNEKTAVLANRVENMIGKGEFDIYQLMKRCTLDMICATTLGLNTNYQSNVEEGDRATNAIEKFLASVSRRIFNVLMYPDFVYKLTRAHKISQHNRDIAEEPSVKIIKNKQESLLKSSVENQKSQDEFEYRKPQIFIDQIMQLSKETEIFDSQAILDEIDTMFLAGQETSALTVAHTILLLAMHQDIQQKVVDELENVLHDMDEPVDYETLSKLEYLDMVLKESLRLFPVAPFLIRKTTEDTQIVSRNLVIPAGVLMVIPIYKIHRDPKEWGPNADEFNPENFRPGNSTNRHNCSYIPFSHGPRNCMGKAYAIMGIKFLLINLLKKCKFHTTYTMETLEKKFEITLKLNHEHSVTVERRHPLV